MPTKVRLADYLQPAHIAVPLNATTLKGALHEMVQRLSKSGAIRDASEIEELLDRPRSRDIVAIGRGVVLPHYRTEAVDTLIVSLGIAIQPLDVTDTGVANAPRVVAMILAPPAAATLYLQTVAALAGFLSDADVAHSIANAKTANDVARHLEPVKIEPRLRVRDVMSREVTTTSPETPIRTVVDLMVERKTRAVVVVNENNQVIGILTEWDVMRAMLPHIPRVGEEIIEEEAEDETARDVMTRTVLCVDEEMGLPEAVNLMINKNAEQCPVVDDGQLVGMLFRSEIIRKLFAR